MTRKTCTAKQALEVAISQGGIIPCFRCKVPFTVEDAQTPGAIEREHLHPLALGGKDEPDNWRWSHKPCHAKQTNGAKHFNNGDKSAIAKPKRLAKGPKKRKGRALPKGQKIPKGQKFQSKPFPKREKQPHRDD